MNDLTTTLAGLIERYFLRYLLPGLNFLVLLVLIPAIKFQPGLIPSIATAGIIALGVVAGLVIGFLLDTLKLYQWPLVLNPCRPGYRQKRDEFFQGISNIYGTKGAKDEGEELVRNFELTAPPGVAKKMVWYKEQWMMCVYTYFLLSLGVALWILFLILEVFEIVTTPWLCRFGVLTSFPWATDLALALIYGAMAWRLRNVAEQQRLSLNKFIHFQMGLRL